MFLFWTLLSLQTASPGEKNIIYEKLSNYFLPYPLTFKEEEEYIDNVNKLLTRCLGNRSCSKCEKNFTSNIFRPRFDPILKKLKS